MSLSGFFFIIFSMALCTPCTSTKNDEDYPNQSGPVDNLYDDDYDRWQKKNDMCVARRNNTYKPDRYCARDAAGSTHRPAQVHLEMINHQTKNTDYFRHTVMICERDSGSTQRRASSSKQIVLCLTGYYWSWYYLRWEYYAFEKGNKPKGLEHLDGICRNPVVSYL